MLTFTLTENGQTRTLKLTQDEIFIGRARDNAVVIRNIKSSRKHARIERTGGVYQVTDLASGNGTKVNGEKISFHTLGAGDEIQIGDAKLVLKSIDDEVKMEAEDISSDTDVDLKIAPLETAETEVEVKAVPEKLATPLKAAAFKVELKKPGAPIAKLSVGRGLKK